jgi:hypothetical protein
MPDIHPAAQCRRQRYRRLVGVTDRGAAATVGRALAEPNVAPVPRPPAGPSYEKGRCTKCESELFHRLWCPTLLHEVVGGIIGLAILTVVFAVAGDGAPTDHVGVWLIWILVIGLSVAVAIGHWRHRQ